MIRRSRVSDSHCLAIAALLFAVLLCAFSLCRLFFSRATTQWYLLIYLRSEAFSKFFSSKFRKRLSCAREIAHYCDSACAAMSRPSIFSIILAITTESIRTESEPECINCSYDSTDILSLLRSTGLWRFHRRKLGQRLEAGQHHTCTYAGWKNSFVRKDFFSFSLLFSFLIPDFSSRSIPSHLSHGPGAIVRLDAENTKQLRAGLEWRKFCTHTVSLHLGLPLSSAFCGSQLKSN